jgi:hypothetical protein
MIRYLFPSAVYYMSDLVCYDELQILYIINRQRRYLCSELIPDKETILNLDCPYHIIVHHLLLMRVLPTHAGLRVMTSMRGRWPILNMMLGVGLVGVMVHWVVLLLSWRLLIHYRDRLRVLRLLLRVLQLLLLML